MDSLGIKPNYAATGRKCEMDLKTVKNITFLGTPGVGQTTLQSHYF